MNAPDFWNPVKKVYDLDTNSFLFHYKGWDIHEDPIRGDTAMLLAVDKRGFVYRTDAFDRESVEEQIDG